MVTYWLGLMGVWSQACGVAQVAHIIGANVTDEVDAPASYTLNGHTEEEGKWTNCY